jgi:undecaprenyl diphosphate synthase
MIGENNVKKFLNFFNKLEDKNTELGERNLEIDINRVPKHIAIIMDGNGRWAQKKNLPRVLGHKAGVEAIREIVKECNNLKIEYLTLYAFSTENWKRPKDEVNSLMKLLVEYLRNEFEELDRNNVIINNIGDINKFPEICQDELRTAYEKTKNNTGLELNLALNYGGRNELVNAFKRINSDIKVGKLEPSEINEKTINNYIYTSGIPDPELIIRTSGELRLSNFLIWQGAYSELHFTDVLWPDFNANDLRKAIIDYQNRDRRFGGV